MRPSKTTIDKIVKDAKREGVSWPIGIYTIDGSYFVSDRWRVYRLKSDIEGAIHEIREGYSYSHMSITRLKKTGPRIEMRIPNRTDLEIYVKSKKERKEHPEIMIENGTVDGKTLIFNAEFLLDLIKGFQGVKIFQSEEMSLGCYWEDENGNEGILIPYDSL